MQVVPAVCAILSLIPLVLVCWLDLDKLERWTLPQTILEQDGCSIHEPLLGECCEAAQDKLGEPALPCSSSQGGTCVDDRALCRASSSSWVET
jgi:hypothetical protein